MPTAIQENLHVFRRSATEPKPVVLVFKFGERIKNSKKIQFNKMALPSDLSSNSENLLTELSFSLTESDDSGMCKYSEWTNEVMKFLLVDDRDYIECEILPYQKPINRINLIRLLRFLKNGMDFYKEELIKANLSYTLMSNDYVELFYNNYNLIKGFVINFNQEKYDNYDKFEYRFDG